MSSTDRLEDGDIVKHYDSGNVSLEKPNGGFRIFSADEWERFERAQKVMSKANLRRDRSESTLRSTLGSSLVSMATLIRLGLLH